MLPAGSLEAEELKSLRFQVTDRNIVGALYHKL
jgi:hypothetical protein